MILETPRLLLREMTDEDFSALHAILSDPETMKYYPKPYDESGTRRWINWCRESYQKNGFGLWAVILKESGEFIGDCGISLQPIHGEWLPEIGYHICKDHWRKGYASEAAAACIRLAFERFDFPAVYSYMKHTNEPSARTAMTYGCRQVEAFVDEQNEITRVFALSREEWHTLQGGSAAQK